MIAPVTTPNAARERHVPEGAVAAKAGRPRAFQPTHPGRNLALATEDRLAIRRTRPAARFRLAKSTNDHKSHAINLPAAPAAAIPIGPEECPLRLAPTHRSRNGHSRPAPKTSTPTPPQDPPPRPAALRRSYDSHRRPAAPLPSPDGPRSLLSRYPGGAGGQRPLAARPSAQGRDTHDQARHPAPERHAAALRQLLPRRSPPIPADLGCNASPAHSPGRRPRASAGTPPPLERFSQPPAPSFFAPEISRGVRGQRPRPVARGDRAAGAGTRAKPPRGRR
ncbi:hypothetical protein MASR1M49_23720 [Pararhodobacter aggregans]